ncbi:amidotransferase [Terrilactibacillus sp. BCM23-1]|uniref:Amidotransferase n=1 Tax=Terrilactibacillus tamarindi TaxID=2599694 RepID=A0A6N8CP49_9BACI|nr:type 1 glutamine amidotransferase [Terrilactibacillus tamarindi]MTT31360.1 amidotransferase [Terrilactibacillus tamarindi]
MKVHIIQHVPYESPGLIEDWCHENNHALEIIKQYESDQAPNVEDVEFLVIMGGPMNIYEDNRYPWLTKEKELISDCILQGKNVFGVCLGAQLIADTLGSKIYQNKEKEIGWFPIQKCTDLNVTDHIPQELMVLHWHGDTFTLPDKATRLFESEVCENQGFIYDKHVIGLQFHVEMTEENLKEIVKHSQAEFQEKGDYIQTEQEIMKFTIPKENKTFLFGLLDKMVRK